MSRIESKSQLCWDPDRLRLSCVGRHILACERATGDLWQESRYPDFRGTESLHTSQARYRLKAEISPALASRLSAREPILEARKYRLYWRGLRSFAEESREPSFPSYKLTRETELYVSHIVEVSTLLRSCIPSLWGFLALLNTLLLRKSAPQEPCRACMDGSDNHDAGAEFEACRLSGIDRLRLPLAREPVPRFSGYREPGSRVYNGTEALTLLSRESKASRLGIGWKPRYLRRLDIEALYGDSWSHPSSLSALERKSLACYARNVIAYRLWRYPEPDSLVY
jgi:hypothetical protein